MTSHTSGGLIKTSTAWPADILRRAEVVAARRHQSRNSVLNYLVARGLEVEEADQADLDRLRKAADKGRESAA